jgi:DNA replication protein DnaD
MQDIVKNDSVIANILHELGVDRSVVAMDRNMYKTWEFDWQMPKDVIDYAVSLAKGKYSAMQYLNRILAEYHRLGIHDLESAKNNKLNFVSATTSAPKENKKSAAKREYTKKELDSLFDEITEVEI